MMMRRLFVQLFLFTVVFCLGMGSIQAMPGLLDSTFGNLGDLEPSVTNAFSTPELSGRNIAAEPDGRIVIIGDALPATNPVYSFYLERLCPNGQTDNGQNCGGPGFGNSGVVLQNFGSAAFDQTMAQTLAIQKDGKIIVAGFFDNSSSNFSEFTLTRYNTDGSLDLSFGDVRLSLKGTRTGTTLIKSTDITDTLLTMAIQSDGKILLAGRANGQFALFRL